MSTDLKSFNKIIILTGAGISAESGIETFRDSGGLWEQHKVEEVATPEAYERNPQLVWRFYSMRRIQAGMAQPNPAHHALVDFTSHTNAQIHLITQNVDLLHQSADTKGALSPICMHGSLNQSRCLNCGIVYFDDHAYFNLKGDYAPQATSLCTATERASMDYLHHYKLEYRDFLPLSPCCRSPLRPHIVWFGEVPLHMNKIENYLRGADLFVSIGTSGQVYPAAGFLQIAKVSGAWTVCINKEEVPQSQWIDEFIQGPASIKVPQYFGEI